MTAITNYDHMRNAIVQARSVDDVKEIRDKAEALRQYAKQVGESLENQNAIAEIKLRAERRAGELLREMERGKPNPNGANQYREVPAQAEREPKSEYRAVLDEAEIAESTARRWQLLADLPEQLFKQYMAEVRSIKKEITSAGAYREAQAYRRKSATKERIASVETAVPKEVVLRNGDFRELCLELPDHSVDLILTDPPYPAEFLPLWEDMARAALRILKPGGYLAAYSGQRFLPEIYAMLGRHLEYQWTAAVRHSAGFHKIWMHDLLNAWKPILIYSNGAPRQKMRGMHDLITGGMGDKLAHHWAQPESEAADLIENLSNVGDTVLDPFMGSGTIPRAAYRMKRLAIGFEVDPAHFRRAKGSFHGLT